MTADPAVFLTLMALGLAPLVPIPYVSDRTMATARDRWLLAGLAVSSVWLASRGELWLAAMACWFLCRWRGPKQTPHLITWVAVAGTWFGALAVVPVFREWLPWVFVWHSLAQTGICVERRWKGRKRPSGTLGSPVLTASLLALTAPFWSVQPWWLWPLPLIGLALTSSWLAILAVLAGLGVLAPRFLPYFALAGLLGAFSALRGWLTWTPRDNSFKSVWARLHVYPMVWQAWRQGLWRWGAGPDTFSADGRRYHMQTGRVIPAGDAHNDVLQMAYEYGWLGLLACGLLVLRVWPHLRLEDSWSAAWVAGGVLACGSYPARHVPLGLTWLAITAGVVTR